MTTITISGTPGSGKSTVAELLHDHLDIPYVYSGMLFRNLAKKYNMTLSEFSTYCEQHKTVDQELDEKQINILKKGNVLLEGRLAGWLAYRHNIDAVKIMIDADEDIRVSRIVNREGGSISQQKQQMKKRQKSERKRYLTYYNIDLSDNSIYDLIIDSSEKTPEQIVTIVIEYLKRKK